MKKQKNVGRMIAIGTIILALFVAIMFVILFNNWFKREETQVAATTEKEEKLLEEIHKTNFYENGWDRKIVAQIVENEVPVPEGFEFVSGTKETGLIIKDKNTNSELMWIPYDENAKVEGIEEYYKNVNYNEIDSETLDSIEKYGGFYVTLEEQNQYETLKQVDNESYQKAVEEANKLYENSNSVNSNLLSLTELQQVLAFANKNGISVTQTSLEDSNTYNTKLSFRSATITKTATNNKALGLVSVNIGSYSNVNNQDSKYDKYYIAQKVLVTVEGKTTYVPIPQGYEYMTIKNENSKNNDIIKIKDEANKNLVYVWVPVNNVESVNSLENAKDELNKLYEQYKVINNWTEANDPTETTEYKEMVASVKEYGGFYIGEAELGFDKLGNLYNKARGMTENLVNNGEYFRTIKKGQNDDYGVQLYLSEYELNADDEDGYYLTYEKALDLVKKAGSSSEATVSHLTYGAEWDAVMLWVMKTNSTASNLSSKMVEYVIKTSVQMPGAKYKGKMNDAEGSNILTEKINKINGIYGLAGNLFDLTQASMVENGVTYRIVRGGSFDTLGNEYPMASRARVEDFVGKNDIGFRNCLYIKADNLEVAETATENKWNGQVGNGFAGGNGTESNPYQIETPEQLAYLAKIVNAGDTCEGKYYLITKNIDLNNKKWTPIGKSNDFKGVLNGNNYSIKGLYVEEEEVAGLIGNLKGNGVVKNVIIESGNVLATKNIAGGIVGLSTDSSSILECVNKAKIETKSKEAGGIVGKAGANVKINGCTNLGEIVAEEEAGGIVGQLIISSYTGETVVSSCINKGKIKANQCCGGIAGATGNNGAKAVIKNCTNEGEIYGERDVGGIAGWAQGETTFILECKNTGRVDATNKEAGGIVGIIGNNVEINSCTNEGEVVAGEESAGGIVGRSGYDSLNNNYEVIGCINKGKIITNKYCGGIIGAAFYKGSIESCKNEGELVCYGMAAGENAGYKEDTVKVTD